MNEKNLTLGITTIGDLLFRKRISQRNDNINEEILLTIPKYQRPYKWSARNAIQLLDDIIDAKNSNKEKYRVGTLILHKEKYIDKDIEGNDIEKTRFNIVDGQQRTITFSLLLYALYENEKGEMKKNISFLEQKLFDNPFSEFNIPNNLTAFRRRVSLKDESADNNIEHNRIMRKLRDYIETQCELIVVITSSISEAFQFFDSQNARGKALYPHDLLKAYHLREMSDIDEKITEKTVKEWESISQKELANFFGNYLYRVKEWMNGQWAGNLNEQNIHKFKGITKDSRSPYAQFYKSAYSYAEMVNNSAMPFVSGTREINAFQLNTPIIAGKPFFDYTQHYYSILKDIQNNDKYEGFYINGNEIVKTLDRYYKNGTGNRIARLLFDTSVLLYVDRFCPPTFPDKIDLELFNQFVIYAFVWAYSLRYHYQKLGWNSAQNYILDPNNGVKNSLNMYRLIVESDTPSNLLSSLADKIGPVSGKDDKIDDRDENEEKFKDDPAYIKYLHFFKSNNFYEVLK